jgi:formylglycine-generating enzyme required for sulfatase activity
MPHLLPRRWLPVVLLSSLVVAVALLAPGQAETTKGKKYALLVGVRNYDHRDLAELKYTENDVEELARALQGFTGVVVLTSTRGQRKASAAPTAKNIRAELKRLLARVTRHDTIVVALAGHGLQIKVKRKGREVEEGFFCPSDARPRSDATLERQSETMLGFTELFRELEESGVGVKLLLVDACRNDPRAGRSVTADAMPRAPRGMAALFSCKPGERAFETDKLGKGHGVFFHHVIQGLRGAAKNRRGEVTWDSLAIYVKEQVSDDVPVLIGKGAKQTPEEIKKLEGKPPVLLTLGKSWDREVTNSIGMKLVRIPAGSFTMGSPAGEEGRSPEEQQHKVEITKDFWLGASEVTQQQFKEVMGYNPSFFSADGTGKLGEEYKSSKLRGKPAGGKGRVSGMTTADFPVENVSWHEAVELCRKLSVRERDRGREYRLPTEAEWEYACRGGTPSSQVFHFGNSLSSNQANFNGSSPYGTAVKGPNLERTCKVGSYAPNAFGLFDMHGNVWEWCHDWYGEDYYRKSPRRDPQGRSAGSDRVIRGGGWDATGRRCRSAYRGRNSPAYRFSVLGFRVALVPVGG